ncbi:MAG: MoaD/ThiS family protein [Chloroflexota bacterium]
MRLIVTLYAPFSDFAGAREVALSLADAVPAGEVLRMLAAAYPKLGPHLAEERPSDEAVLLLVNGRLAQASDLVHAGDEVILLPQITGG